MRRAGRHSLHRTPLWERRRHRKASVGRGKAPAHALRDQHAVRVKREVSVALLNRGRNYLDGLVSDDGPTPGVDQLWSILAVNAETSPSGRRGTRVWPVIMLRQFHRRASEPAPPLNPRRSRLHRYADETLSANRQPFQSQPRSGAASLPLRRSHWTIRIPTTRRNVSSPGSVSCRKIRRCSDPLGSGAVAPGRPLRAPNGTGSRIA